MSLHAGRSLSAPELADRLQEARARTLLLVTGVSDADLRLQHDPLMSPIVWDLGHIAHFEEVWLLENIEGDTPGREGLRGMYDPFRNPRAGRAALDLPRRSDALEYLAEVRAAVLRRIPDLDPASTTPLLAEGFVFRMVLQHEYQHGETILQTLQLKQGEPWSPPRALGVPAAGPESRGRGDDDTGPAMVRIPGGAYPVGTDDRSAAYDNERPRHTVELAPYRIDRTPVTAGDWLSFMADGGYERPELWADEGWAWRSEAGIEAPKYWRRDQGRWLQRVFDLEREVDPRRPVCHVDYWEADAFARWAGKRLPTEAEWEVAALWDASEGRMRRFPWGDEPATPLVANIDQLAFDTLPVGSLPAGASPSGCLGMIGDVWEWTSTPFHGYPGYRTFPYPEYSEVFFGSEYRVLRGGSWATRSGAIRGTFRNWDYPIRRQIFSGLRCAADD